MSTKDDRLKYDNYFYNPYKKELIKIDKEVYVDVRWTPHHYIRQQWIRNNPEKFKKVEHLQKIIFLPSFVNNLDNMHLDLHNKNRNFKEKWGIDEDILLFDENV